ncbi:hypothetical protein [Candidatus Stoquefichus sp. SB1]|uniref:hypothetical protein n=1 Tax=Candidatus Stoquefichus sp. SB1 TaxID=1658109 RepID=UPI00067EA2EA|nr:hypothetical protein [Candidatus Stoquefichus sp. SB1]
MKKTLRILVAIYTIVLFVPQFAQAGIRDFENKIYAEKQFENVMTIQIGQDIKTQNSQNVLSHIKGVMDEYHSSIFFTKNESNKYHKYIYTNSQDYFQKLGINGYQSIDLLQSQYSLDIQPLDNIVEKHSVNGEAVIVCNQTQSKRIKEALENVLDTQIDIVNDEMNTMDYSMFAILIMISFTILLLLIIIYDMYQKYKLFSVKKLCGFSHGDIWLDEITRLLMTCICILFPGYTFLTFIMTQKLNDDVIQFLMTSYQMVIIAIVLIFVFASVAILIFSHVKIGEYLKGKSISDSFLYFNQFIMALLIMVGIMLSMNATSYIESIMARIYNSSQWETMQNYYIIPTIQQTEGDESIAQSEWLKNSKKAFIELSHQGTIYADFNDYFDDGSIEEGYYYQSRIPIVNNEYLKVNKIVNSQGKVICIDEKEERQVLLVPDDDKYDKVRLAEDIKNIGYEKNDDVIFVYYKCQQSFFSYNSRVIHDYTNSLKNIVVAVRTENNGDDIDYDRIMGYKGNPLKIKAKDKNEVISVLKKYGLEKYPVQVISAYDDMADLNNNEMITTICLILTIGLLIVLMGKAIYQGLYCYVNINQKLIAVKKLHGFSLLKQYDRYFLLNLSMFFFIAFALIFLQYHILMVLLFVMFAILYWITLFVIKIKRSKEYYTSSILKGESL